METNESKLSAIPSLKDMKPRYIVFAVFLGVLVLAGIFTALILL